MDKGIQISMCYCMQQNTNKIQLILSNYIHQLELYTTAKSLTPLLCHYVIGDHRTIKLHYLSQKKHIITEPDCTTYSRIADHHFYPKKIFKSELCISQIQKRLSAFFNTGFDAINFHLVLCFQNMLLILATNDL